MTNNTRRYNTSIYNLSNIFLKHISLCLTCFQHIGIIIWHLAGIPELPLPPPKIIVQIRPDVLPNEAYRQTALPIRVQLRGKGGGDIMTHFYRLFGIFKFWG